jgi:hypothetical protein
MNDFAMLRPRSGVATREVIELAYVSHALRA